MSSADTAPADDVGDLIERLERTEHRLSETEARVEEFGQARVEQLADAYRRFTGLLDRYEDQVVGDAGDVKTNIEFQSQVADVVGDIPSRTLLYETFTECSEYLKQKWFNESDFEHVREQLEPVGDIVARLENYEAAQSDFRQAHRDVQYRIRDLDERIADLERLVELDQADLTAPTERLREPIESYNEAATGAFEQFVAERSSRDVLDVLDAMEAYPLVPFESPPDGLVRYLREEEPGEMPIPKLLEFARYSRSKLDHYVEDPDRFARVVGGQQTFLSGLSPEPLRIGWPPPSADHLRVRCRELTAALNRIDPSVVERLRAVAALRRETDYERLRDSAVAREQLSEGERERLRTGDVESDLERLREQRARLETALSDARDPP